MDDCPKSADNSKRSNSQHRQTWSAWNASTRERPVPPFRLAPGNTHIKPVSQPNASSALYDVKTVAFVGASGTGKSHRAVEVARSEGISFIIDDGLLISNNRIIEGKSAKNSKTKVGALKRAVFFDEKERNDMMRAIRIHRPNTILILGTSRGMTEKIAARLCLPKVSKTICIEDVASHTEIEQARQTRNLMGKHVIPVATFELKKDFSGLLIDRLQWMRWKDKVIKNYDVERSVVRPTFSMLGKYEISDKAIKQLVFHLAKKEQNVRKVRYVMVDKHGNGINIRVEVVLDYGKCIRPIIQKIQHSINKQVSLMTALYIYGVDVYVSKLYVPNEAN